MSKWFSKNGINTDYEKMYSLIKQKSEKK
jgi:hypothetical protein